ncbi:MAG: hypothetical protein B6U78_01745 [Candidatus Aenigmarchaeota archaeon ex4484_224]|nr:MAG: hypothetical protein B6U78_01745 [Candidatus Aenigmarchaeota archaeon ex4484_224]
MERLIEKIFLGRTSSGAEVYILKAKKPEVIAAVRSDVSTHKVSKKIFGELKSSVDDIIEYFSREENYETAEKLVKRVTASHGDMGEYEYIGIYLKNVSRLTTLIGWIISGSLRKEYMPGTEKSLRYVPIEGSVEEVFVQSLENYKILEKALDLYKRMVASGIPKEDARYILPLATKTEEILQPPPGRMTRKWIYYMLYSDYQEAREIGKILKDWYDKEYVDGASEEVRIADIPKSKLPLFKKGKTLSRRDLEKRLNSFDKIREELYAHFDVISKTLTWNATTSISSFHQDIRNRQVYFDVESLEEVIIRKEIVIPTSIKISRFKEEFENLAKEMFEIAENLFRKDPQQAVYYLPLGTKINFFGRITGEENIVDIVYLRTCRMAQSEIRARYILLGCYVSKIAEEEDIEELKRLLPRCLRERRCFEFWRERCPVYKKWVKRKRDVLN